MKRWQKDGTSVVEQIEAEMATIAVRKQHLVELHNRAIDRLKSKRETIDRTIIKLHESKAIAFKLQ